MVVSKKVRQALQRGAFVKQCAKEYCDWKQVILNAELSECQCSTTLSVTCKFLSLELSLDFLTGGGVELYALPNMFICSCTIERNRESSGSVLKQISCCSHRYILTLLTGTLLVTNLPTSLLCANFHGYKPSIFLIHLSFRSISCLVWC